MRIVDARSLDRADFAAALELQQTLDRERDPGLPVTPAAELRAVFDDDATDYCRHQRIVAFDGDRATAIGHLELNSDPANANLAGVEITPSDDKTAAAVLAELLRQARSDGRTSVIAWGDHTPAAHTFWTGLGAELRYTEQESRLEWPRWAMARWEAGPADRARELGPPLPRGADRGAGGHGQRMNGRPRCGRHHLDAACGPRSRPEPSGGHRAAGSTEVFATGTGPLRWQ